ncbi:BCL2 associated agonist of cell death b isoform X1 [Electrophorus electricus]|uniref:BCL2 associated agonist of cell death b n=1 Tax=Electrophorus electricus TaxID=8005 RepID=A0A4W4HE29_ELEEL|nr:BCL2 associated agonist of cell death b isoform X1 [Electrophorus electricus]
MFNSSFDFDRLRKVCAARHREQQPPADQTSRSVSVSYREFTSAAGQLSEVVFTMAQMFTISDTESDTSEGPGDTDQQGDSKEPEPSQSEQHLHVPNTLRGEWTARQRNHSMNEAELQDSGAESFRRRSRSAPPILWAAKKYGRQLRKMSDEFDTLLDKGMKRARSAGAARQMHTSPSWFAFLWSHKESDTETSSSVTAPDTRPAE